MSIILDWYNKHEISLSDLHVTFDPIGAPTSRVHEFVQTWVQGGYGEMSITLYITALKRQRKAYIGAGSLYAWGRNRLW